MRTTTYKTVSIPRDLYARIEERLATGGYSSVAEYVKESVRLRLERA